MNQPDDNRPVVLLIDDDQTLHLWGKRNLPSTGFMLVSCFDGNEGIKEFQKRPPNIVLIDIEMPTMDGIETCERIRRLPGGDIIPIIIMTVSEDAQKIAEAFAAGATDFVVKPINWEILGHRMHFMVKSSNNVRKLAQNELRLSKAKHMAKLGDWEWQLSSRNLFWSDEIYDLVEVDRTSFIPNTDNYWGFIFITDIPYVKRQVRNVIKTKSANTIEFRIVTAQNNERYVSQHIEAVRNGNGQTTSLIGTVQDITEQKNQENKILHLAYYDEVTQLPNRVFFLKYLAKTISLSRRYSWNFALLFLDLDGFKGINDTYGHQAGDLLLQEVSRRLIHGLRCSDFTSRYNLDQFEEEVDVARLGGDEFIVLLNALTRPEDAATVAERIQRWITEPILLGDRTVHIGVSTGIALYPHDGTDSDTLLRNADIAMYHAKELGKGHYQFFHEDLALKAKKRLEIETYMFQAATKKELRLYYQPVIDITSGQLQGAEALLRWESPQLGFLMPNYFIPLAEENGMIIHFGEWTIREVCRQYKAWQQTGIGAMTIAVNLSSLQLNQHSFVPMVAEILKEFEADSGFLTFEITETMLMADTENVLKKLKELKALGIRLSIDDFGTGYSSLRYLNQFPLDTLKIDRSFIKDLPNSADASAIVNAILALAKALKLKTVAEGVETQQQQLFLQNTSCDAVQGYYFSKPMPAEEFHAYWLQQTADAPY